MKQNKVFKTYEEDISKLEVSKVDTSSNYKQAEQFMLKVIQDEKVPKEIKIEIGKKVTEHLLLTDEQKSKLSNWCKEEYSKTKQSNDEYIDNLLSTISDDDNYIYELVPYMDYTEKHGLSYMAIAKIKGAGYEKYFVSSKKDLVPYKNCEQVSIFLKHTKNKSSFGLKSYIQFFKGNDNVKAVKVFKTIKQQLKKYIIFPHNSLYDIVALWIMHTYVYCIFRYVPYIWLNADAGSGKSTVMDIIIQYAFNGLSNVGSTPAVIFRTIENNGSTLALDEFENMNGEDKSLILTILKVGFKSGAIVSRCSEKNYEPVVFSAFSPKIFAGISDIDNVLLTRCIKINMKMAKDKSSISDFDLNNPERKIETAKIKNELYIFGLKYADKISNYYNDSNLFSLEQDYTPREKDLWQPLMAIAKVVDDEENLDLENSINSYSKILHEELRKATLLEVKPRLLQFLDTYIKDPFSNKEENWYWLSELYYAICDTGDFPEIKSFESLGIYMSKLGFEKKRKPQQKNYIMSSKMAYYISKDELERIKKANGYTDI